MPLSETREKVSRGLLDFAWRQWSQLGVSAGTGADDEWAVDPEALILFTVGVGRGDPRLFDEMLDWIALNQRLLSVQRLRNLKHRFAVDADLVAAIVTWAKEPPADALEVGHDVGSLRSAAKETGQLRPVFRPEILGFVPQAGTEASDYLLASQARSLMDKVSFDLQAAGVTIPDRHSADGAAYLPVFVAVSDAVLASIGITTR